MQELVTTRNSDDRFGHSLDISGDYIVVGAHQDNEVISHGGAVYVFKRNEDGTFKRIAKLLDNRYTQSDTFGVAVAIDADTIVVGSPNHDSPLINCGRACIWKIEGDNVNLIRSIEPPDISPQEKFGLAVEVWEDWVFISSLNDEFDHNAGAVYAFLKDHNGNYELAQKLMPPSEYFGADVGQWASTSLFGSCIACEAGVLVIGSHKADPVAWDSGAVYVYHLDPINLEWKHTQRLFPSDAGKFDEFGKSVDTDGDSIIVGAWNHRNNRVGGVSGPGAAFIFSWNGVKFEETDWLRKETPIDADYFGHAVAIQNGEAYVSILNDSEINRFSGCINAYILNDNGEWVFRKAIRKNVSRLGQALAINNNLLVYSSADEHVFIEDTFITEDNDDMGDSTPLPPQMPTPNVLPFTEFGGGQGKGSGVFGLHPMGIPLQPGEDIKFKVLLGVPPGAGPWPGGGEVRVNIPGLPSPVIIHVPVAPIVSDQVGEFMWTPSDSMVGNIVIPVEYISNTPGGDTSGTDKHFTFAVTALAGDHDRNRKVDNDDLVTVISNWTR